MANDDVNQGNNLPEKKPENMPAKKANLGMIRKENLPEKAQEPKVDPNSKLQTWSVPESTGPASGVSMSPPPTPPHEDVSNRKRTAPKTRTGSPWLMGAVDKARRVLGRRWMLLGSLALLPLSNMARFGNTAEKVAIGMEIEKPGKGKVSDPAVEGGMKLYIYDKLSKDVDTVYYQRMNKVALHQTITPKLVKESERVKRSMNRDEIDKALVLKFQAFGVEIVRAIKYEQDYTGKTKYDLSFTDRVSDMAVGHDQGMIGVEKFSSNMWTGPDDPHKDLLLADGTKRIDSTKATPLKMLYDFIQNSDDVVVIPVSKSKYYELKKESGWISTSTESSAKNSATGPKGP